VSRVISYTGRYRWAIWSGWSIATLGSGLLLLLDEATSPYAWITIFLIFGLGNGCLLSAINFSIQASAGVDRAGKAASMYTFFRSLGMAVGVAVGSNAFQNVMARRLQHFGLPTAIAKNAESYIYKLQGEDAADPTKRAVIEAYVHGFHGVFYILVAVGATAMMLSLAVNHYQMSDNSGEQLEDSTIP
jgi:MFS family permease